MLFCYSRLEVSADALKGTGRQTVSVVRGMDRRIAVSLVRMETFSGSGMVRPVSPLDDYCFDLFPRER
jgi:hypothetical protein